MKFNPTLISEKIRETWYGVSRGGAPLSTGAPHFRDSGEIKRYMATVILALLPALISGVLTFGSRALLVLLVSYACGGIVEIAFAVIRRKPIEEGFLVTGMIYALTLPAELPLFIVAVGIIFGTFFGKELFGGTGRNVFNPALVGRLFITISFPAAFSAGYVESAAAAAAAGTAALDAVSAATPLAAWSYGDPFPLRALLFAGAPGAIGETSRFLLILGGLYLLWTRVADWRIPLTFLGSAALFSQLLFLLDPVKFPPPLYTLLSGGLILGAFFMATDPVTSPLSGWGKAVYGGSCAVLTLLFRGFSSYPEGVMFAIILSNSLAHFFDEALFAFRFPPVREHRQ
jgi:RnfABCDGE-type electron transport complex D subunit